MGRKGDSLPFSLRSSKPAFPTFHLVSRSLRGSGGALACPTLGQLRTPTRLPICLHSGPPGSRGKPSFGSPIHMGHGRSCIRRTLGGKPWLPLPSRLLHQHSLQRLGQERLHRCCKKHLLIASCIRSWNRQRSHSSTSRHKEFSNSYEVGQIPCWAGSRKNFRCNSRGVDQKGSGWSCCLVDSTARRCSVGPYGKIGRRLGEERSERCPCLGIRKIH